MITARELFEYSLQILMLFSISQKELQMKLYAPFPVQLLSPT